MHDERIVVVDEECLDRWLELLLEEQTGHVQDIDGSGACGCELWARQPVGCFREGVPCAAHEAATGHPELARECRQGCDGAEPRAAVLIALEPIAPRDDRGRGLLVPAREGATVPDVDTAD